MVGRVSSRVRLALGGTGLAVAHSYAKRVVMVAAIPSTFNRLLPRPLGVVGARRRWFLQAVLVFSLGKCPSRRVCRSASQNPAPSDSQDRVSYRSAFLAATRWRFRRRVLCLLSRFLIFCLLLLRAIPSSGSRGLSGPGSPLSCLAPGRARGGRSLSELGVAVDSDSGRWESFVLGV